MSGRPTRLLVRKPFAGNRLKTLVAERTLPPCSAPFWRHLDRRRQPGAFGLPSAFLLPNQAPLPGRCPARVSSAFRRSDTIAATVLSRSAARGDAFPRRLSAYRASRVL